MCIFRQKLIMGVPFIKNKQKNKHPCEPFHLNLCGLWIMGNVAKMTSGQSASAPVTLLGLCKLLQLRKTLLYPDMSFHTLAGN